MEFIEFRVDGWVATIEFNRPEKLNAQNLGMRRELVEVCGALRYRPDVRAVVLTGRGRAFSVGHDLVEELTPEEAAIDPGGMGIYGALLSVPVPVIAAINGVCLAQGAGLALLSDIRIAHEGVEFGWPQAQRGIASLSGPVIMARQLPTALAAELLYCNRALSAEEAKRHGLLNEVVPQSQVLDRAMEIAHEISRSAPLAVRASKEIMRHTAGMALTDALVAGERMARLVNFTEDAREGHRAFAERREPQWTGR